jgi:hypothetical protein
MSAARMAVNDRERLIRYVRGVFKRSKSERWPTVRDCARGLKLSIDAVEQLADEGRPLMLTSYGIHQRIADHFVEICE